jgi:hypothetical protein
MSPYHTARRARIRRRCSDKVEWSELNSLGARPAAAIVARRLRERGARSVPRGPRPATQANPAALTARELEVLGFVAQGLQR